MYTQLSKVLKQRNSKGTNLPNYDEPILGKEVGTLNKASKATTSNYPEFSGKNKSDIQPTENFQEVLELIENDEELKAFISILRDTIARSDYKLIGKKSVKNDEKILKKLRFRKIQKRFIFDLLIFKHAFIEIERHKFTGKAKALHVLDPTLMRPFMNAKGVILFWFMADPKAQGAYDPANGTGIIKWKPEDLCHLQIDEMTPYFYGKTDLYTLKTIVKLKHLVVEHMERMFEQNWFRIHFNGEGVDINDVQSFVDMFMDNMENRNLPLVTVSDKPMKGERYLQESVVLPLIELLNHLRNKILTLLRVPPIIAGTVDNSNRSNSDIQANFALLNRVQAIQEDIEDDLLFGLLPKIGISSELKYTQNTTRELREILDIAIMVINAGGKPDIVNKYIVEKGYDVPEDMFMSLEESDKREEKKTKSAESSKLDKNSNLQPSRQKQDNSSKDGFGVKEVKN